MVQLRVTVTAIPGGRDSLELQLQPFQGPPGCGISAQTDHRVPEATNEIDFSGGIAWCAAILRKGLLVEIGPRSVLTLPTKVPSDSLGGIGSLKRTSDKSLFPMALDSCGHRITHQLRPINMNGRSILSVTSVIGKGRCANFFLSSPVPCHDGYPDLLS